MDHKSVVSYALSMVIIRKFIGLQLEFRFLLGLFDLYLEGYYACVIHSMVEYGTWLG